MSAGESQTNDFEDDAATAQRAVVAIGIIAAALDGIADAGPSQPLTPSTTQRVFLLAHGWFASIVRTSELVALAHGVILSASSTGLPPPPFKDPPARSPHS